MTGDEPELIPPQDRCGPAYIKLRRENFRRAAAVKHRKWFQMLEDLIARIYERLPDKRQA